MLGLAFSLVTLLFNLLVQLMVLTLRFGFVLVRLAIWALPVLARLILFAIRVVGACVPAVLAACSALCPAAAGVTGLLLRRLRPGTRGAGSSAARGEDVS